MWKDQGKFLFTHVISACIFCSAFSAIAAPAPLEWNEVKDLAQAQNPSLKSADLTWDSSKSAVKQTYGAFLPAINLNARHTRTITDVSVLENKSVDRTYSVAASWNIFNGLASIATLQKAKASEGEAHANRDLASANLRSDLRRAFFNVYIQQERILLFERILTRTQQNERLISLKYNSGSEARWNLLITSSDRERAEYNLETAKADLSSARDLLARYLHVNQLPDRTVAAPTPEMLQAQSVAIDEVIKSHPQLRAAEFAEKRLSRDQAIARSSFLPTLDLSYARSRDDSLTGANLRTDSNTYAVVASWNIFNGFSDFYKVQQANINHEAAELNTESLSRELSSTLFTAYTNFKKAVALLPSAKSLRIASDERVRTVSTQYRSGLKTYLDWETAESQLLDAEQADVSAQSNALLSLVDLERAIGILLEQP